MMIILVFLLGMLGCATEELQCSEETSCGFGEICVEGTCIRNSCASSVQCEMEEYCAQGNCTEG